MSDEWYTPAILFNQLGLEFDLGQDGELEMNPAGREAARKRQNRGINFPSMFRK
jgi:hypothetical protein